MQKFYRQLNFEAEWKTFYKIIKLINKDIKSSSIDKYAYSLYDRALYIFDAYVLIEKSNNASVQNILLRNLYEIKVKSAKYKKDRDTEIGKSNTKIKTEIEFFLKKIKTGKSFTSQILWERLKERNFQIVAINEIPNRQRKTIKNEFEDAGLGFDYEILYWLTSLFTHTNPLSLLIEQKEQYPQNEIIDILANISRDIDLLNINFLGTVLWITKYLFETEMSSQTLDEIEKLWEINRKKVSKKYNIDWKTSDNKKENEMTIEFDENKINLKRD